MSARWSAPLPSEHRTSSFFLARASESSSLALAARARARSARAASMSVANSQVSTINTTLSPVTSAKPSETAAQRPFDPGDLELQLADPHRREEALVPGQHAEVAFRARHDDAIDGSFEAHAFGRHDGELDRHQTSRLAFSTASSIVPTMKNACSGSVVVLALEDLLEAADRVLEAARSGPACR